MPVLLTRRSVLALFGAAAVPSTAAPLRVSTEISLLRCSVAGLCYYDYSRVAGVLAAGAPLVLRRQPANLHDPCAIEVLTEEGTKLGYVPRVHNAAVASLMDAGYMLLARIASHDPASNQWRRLSMEMSMVERAGVRTTTG